MHSPSSQLPHLSCSRSISRRVDARTCVARSDGAWSCVVVSPTQAPPCPPCHRYSGTQNVKTKAATSTIVSREPTRSFSRPFLPSLLFGLTFAYEESDLLRGLSLAVCIYRYAVGLRDTQECFVSIICIVHLHQ